MFLIVLMTDLKYIKLLKPNIKIKSILPPIINYDYVQIGNGVCINTGVKLEQIQFWVIMLQLDITL